MGGVTRVPGVALPANPSIPTMRIRILVAFGLALSAGAALCQTGTAESPAVQTLAFERLAIRPQREAPATVVPRNEARLSAEVAGRVLRWTADAGANVARGALLVELDATDHRLARDQAQAALAASQARLTLADKQMQRARELVAQGFFSQEALAGRETELQLARAELASQRAQLAAAQRALAKTRIRAPFAASVKERLAQAGEFVAAGTPLYVLTQTDRAEVSAQIAPGDVEGVRRSAKLEFAGNSSSVPLKLLRVASTVTAPARTVEVRLQPGRPLVAGAQGRLLWHEDRPHVPASMLVRREGQLGVFVVEDGKARFVALPGAQEGRAAAATLAPQAQVVVSGQAALRDGQSVAVAR